MKIVEQGIEFLDDIDDPSFQEQVLNRLESASRTCYKSEYRNPQHDPAMRDRLLRHVVGRGHLSVLEHVTVGFRVTTNRGISHAWVRHRVGVAYSQESTIYCNYGNDDKGITVIWPDGLGLLSDFYKSNHDEAVTVWFDAMCRAERAYLALLKLGKKPWLARGVLPTDLKTELVCTMNLRALRHFCTIRVAPQDHPQICTLSSMLLTKLAKALPVIFGDLVE